MFCPDCTLTVALYCVEFSQLWHLTDLNAADLKHFKTQLTDIHKPFSLVHLSANYM